MIDRMTTRITGITRGARITREGRWVVALAALGALIAGLSGALAEHPSDLKLTLKVHDNAAAVAPEGSTIIIDGEFAYTGAYDELSLTAGELRVGGGTSLEWEERDARTRLTLPAQRSGVDGALTGAAVAVQQRGAGDGGDIVVVGAPKDWVGQHEHAGSVDVYVNGAFVTRLTAEGNAAAGAQFGYSVDVAGEVIVVGAPFEGGILDHTKNSDEAIDGDDDERPEGAVYVFTWDSTDMAWERAARLTPVNFPSHDHDGDTNTPDEFLQTRPIAKFGHAVAIDDAGDNIAVAHEPATVGTEGSTTTPDRNRWRALGQVFSKPSGDDGWADQSIVKGDMEPEIAYLNVPTGVDVGLGQGDIDISGDGEVIALGVPDRDVDTDGDGGTADKANFGGVLIYLKPTGTMADWNNANDQTTTGRRDSAATLDVSAQGDSDTAYDDVDCMLMGASVALDQNGDLLVVGAPGSYTTPCGGGTGTATKNTWKGAAFVFAKPGTGWANATEATAALTEPAVGGDPVPATDGKAGELFGQAVAINDGGTLIIVGNAADPTDSHAKGYAHVYKQPVDAGDNPTPWVNDADADVKLESPPTTPATTKLAFGAGVALDGTVTAVVGQTEALEHLSQIAEQENIISGHGRAYSFDLTDPTGSPPPDITTTWQGTAARLGPLTMPCATSGSGDSRKWNCDLSTTGVDARIVIVTGTADGTKFTINQHGMMVNEHEPNADTLTVTVGRLAPVDRLRFDPKSGQSRSVEAGSTVNLVASIQAEGKAASPQVIQSVIITAAGGRLSSPAGVEGGGCSGVSCQLDISKLHSTGSGIQTNSIPVTWVAPSQTGARTLTLTVTHAAGVTNPPSLSPRTVRITVTGAATELSIGAPNRPLFHRPTSDDDRDVARFRVAAKDSEDRVVVPPDTLSSWSVVLSGTERSFKSKFELTRVPATGQSSGQVHLELRVKETDLSPGSYQLRVKLGNRAEGRRTFTVVGGPARVRLQDSGQRTIGGRLTYEARVLDSNGNAVADGTEVTFELVRAPGSVAVLAPSTKRTLTTSGGRVSSTYVVVTTGTAVMKVCDAETGNRCDVKNFSVGGFIPPVGGGSGGGGGGGGGFVPPVLPPTTPTVTTPPPPPPPAASFLTSRSPGTQAVWEGTGSARASELLADLLSIGGLFMWNSERWLPYGRVGTLIIPGSVDFVAFNGAIIWLAPLGRPAQYVTTESSESGAAGGEDSSGSGGDDGSGDEEDTGDGSS